MSTIAEKTMNPKTWMGTATHKPATKTTRRTMVANKTTLMNTAKTTSTTGKKMMTKITTTSTKETTTKTAKTMSLKASLVKRHFRRRRGRQ